MIDCLAHLADHRVEDPLALLNRAASAGVRHVICGGVDPATDRQINVAGRLVQIHQAWGIHPMAIADHRAQLDQLTRKLDAGGCIAIGEVGLDARSQTPMETQTNVLRSQLELARRYDLPLIIHCVRAFGPLLDVLRKQPVRGVVHGICASEPVITELQNLGLHFGVGGMATQPDAKRCRNAAATADVRNLVLESDTPDHPPAGWEGASEPAAIAVTAQHLARIRGCPMDEVVQRCTENAKRLFAL